MLIHHSQNQRVHNLVVCEGYTVRRKYTEGRVDGGQARPCIILVFRSEYHISICNFCSIFPWCLLMSPTRPGRWPATVGDEYFMQLPGPRVHAVSFGTGSSGTTKRRPRYHKSYPKYTISPPGPPILVREKPRSA